MTHPFDDLAIEAAAKAYLRSKNNITTDAAWEATTPALRENLIDFQEAALSAAFKSATERGMAFEGFGPMTFVTALEPVTIIRHKEPT